MMKTISIQADVMGRVQGTRQFTPQPRYQARVDRCQPVWLPTPTLPARTLSQPKRTAATSLWLAPEPESLGERLLLGFLTLGAVAAVVAAFGSVAGFVQDWPLLERWVAQLLQ